MNDLTVQKDRRDALRSRLSGRDALLARERRLNEGFALVVKQNEADAFDFSKAIDLCRVCIKEQSDARKHIEDIITALLNATLQKMYAEREPDGNVPEYRFVLEPVEDVNGVLKGLKPKIYKNGQPDDVRRYGGGARNMVSMGHRLTQLLLNPSLSPILMLDEPLSNIASWGPIIKFLTDLQMDIPLQVICITHSNAEFPHVVEIWKDGDVSKVREFVA